MAGVKRSRPRARGARASVAPRSGYGCGIFGFPV